MSAFFAYDELPVRAVSAPLRISPVRCSYAIMEQIALHPLTTVTAACALSLDPDVVEHIVAAAASPSAEVLCLMPPYAWATLSSSVCPTVSNAAGSSQPLAPTIDKTSNALLVAACGRRDIYMYVTPSRCSLPEYSSLSMTDSLARRRNTPPSDSVLAHEPSLRPAPAVGVRMDVLLVTHARAGSEWRRDAVRCAPRVESFDSP
ncbi:hypothetical protein C8R44DRAFT_890133 [Mycena epipterygia]|nr:hypothetical protein C8R44DRAFT_890133 [Mycena epipterygia]